MKLLVFVLNEEEKLEEILEGFLEIGIKGATVIESVGMGKIISQDIPIFAGLRDLFASSSPHNRTIFSIIEDEMVDKTIHIINKIMGDIKKEPGKGILFFLNVDTFISAEKELT